MPQVDGYQNLVLSPCVDNAQMDTNFASLNALIREMVLGTDDVVCTALDATATGSFNSGEVVTEIFPEQRTTTLETTTEKCLFLGSIQVTRNFIAGQPAARIGYTLSCGDKVIAQGTAYSGAISPMMFIADCNRGDAVTIATFVENGAGETTETTRIEYDLKLCGGRVCTGKRDIKRAGAYVPCFPTGACCLGRDSLALITQNLNALTSAFAFGGKSIITRQVVALDDESVPVELNLENDSVYVVLGSIQVCFENSVREGTSVTVQPVIGCTSDGTAPCVLGTSTPKGYGLKILRETCERFPVLTCGTCAAGEDLYIGQNPNFECNAEPAGETVTSGYSIKGVYCVYIFTDIVKELSTLAYPPQCITTDYLQSLETRANTLSKNIASRATVNCTTRSVDVFEQGGAAGEQTPVIIQEAIPFVPPIDDPTATASKKKWFITGEVFICSEPYTTNIEDQQWATIGWQLACGGVPLTDPNGDVISGSCPWILADSGSTRLCSPRLDIVGNVECITDEDLQLIVTVETPGSSRFQGPWTTYGSVQALCF